MRKIFLLTYSCEKYWPISGWIWPNICSLFVRISFSLSSVKYESLLKIISISGLISIQSSSVKIPFRIHCALSACKKICENLVLSLSMYLLKLTSSLVISADLPILKPLSACILVMGTLSAVYTFLSKYSTSSIWPRFCPPGRVLISVPLPPSRRGR